MAKQEIVPYQEKVTTLRGMLTRAQSQITMALPKHITPEKMIRTALTCAINTPRLLDCEPASICGAVIQAAALGLVPGVTGQAYLIPFWNGKTGRLEAQFMPGYQGLVDLAYRSGKVDSIVARVVREGDQFDYSYGLEDKLEHKPSRTDGALLAAYAVVRLTGVDRPEFTVMEAWEINAIRAAAKERNKGKEGTPWIHHTAEMWKKTVLRRMCKSLPKSVDLHEALGFGDQVEAGLPQNLGNIIDVGSDPADDPTEPTPKPEGPQPPPPTDDEPDSEMPPDSETAATVRLLREEEAENRDRAFDDFANTLIPECKTATREAALTKLIDDHEHLTDNMKADLRAQLKRKS
jgi:recombination protein RecT